MRNILFLSEEIKLNYTIDEIETDLVANIF